MKRTMGRINGFVLSLLFAGLFAGSAYGQSAEQTDWSGGGGIQGPVTDWTDDWYQGGQIEWQGRPGEVFLEGEPIGTITESLIGTATQFSVIVGGDVDGDGDDDIVAYESDAGGDLYWYENTNGDGSSWTNNGIWSGVPLLDVIVADMDGVDGLDVIGIQGTNYVHIWLNDGTGGIEYPWTQVDINGGFAGGRDIKVGDIDGDGDLDIFAASQDTDWYGNINGDALSWDVTAHYGFGDCVAADLADFDGDGDFDVLCIRQSAGTEVLWHENLSGDGVNWDTHFETVINNDMSTTEVLAADMDGDGDPDVVACGYEEDAVYWWENIDAASDSWGGTVNIFQSGSDYGPQSLRVFDPDLDGDADIVVVGFNSNQVIWWENDGAPVPTWVEHPIDDNLTNAVSVCFGDFTSSGLLDVAACRNPELNWYEIVSYVPTGFLESSILDVGMTNHNWGVINFNLDLPTDTSLVVEVRSSNDSANMGSWTSADDGQDLSNYVTDGEQYFQYQLSLLTTNQHETPIFYDLAINWANPNAPVFDPSHSYLLALEYSQTNTITCGLTGQPADSITLYYLPGGDMGDWSTVSMTDDGGGIWSYDLPWDDRFVSGLEYGFYAENSDGSTWYPNGMPDSTYGIVAVTHFGEFTFPFALPPGNDVGDYRLISTPFNFIDGGNPDAQFLDELGSYDPANWRLFLWNNGSGDYVEFNPDTDNFDLQAGDAWWIITKDGLSELTFTELESVLTGSDFGIQIYAGWNLFGSPYLFNVNWADCYTNIDANVEQPLTWIVGDYATATELTSMVGYWLWADADDTLYIPPYAVVGVARQPDSTTLTVSQPARKVGDRLLPELCLPEVVLAAESTTPLRSSLLTAEAVADAGWGSADSWRLAFRLENAVGGDSLHQLGVDPLAGNYDDVLERHDPPSLTGRPNLFFNHEDWPHGSGLYSTDLREPYSEGANWQFYLEGEDAATLSWVVENGWCAGFIAAMETPAGRRVDLLADDSVSLTAAELASSLPCRVFVGTKDYVEGELTGTSRLSLAQSYPNPATSLTRIEYALPTAGEVSLTVYDLAGRRVATLVAGEQAAGRHAVGWEVADIPSGVYLYRLETSEGTLTRRAVISR